MDWMFRWAGGGFWGDVSRAEMLLQDLGRKKIKKKEAGSSYLSIYPYVRLCRPLLLEN